MPRQHGRRRRRQKPPAPGRATRYGKLINPLAYQKAFSDDQIESIHNTALRVLEELGIRFLSDKARRLLADAGAECDNDMMVRLDRALVQRALDTAPAKFTLKGRSADNDVVLGGRHTSFACVGGPPHVSDLDRGKRPGTLEDNLNFIKLSEYFDVFHVQSVNVEAQDLPVHLRHLHTLNGQLTLSGKPVSLFARGTGQVSDAFEMIRIVNRLSAESFRQQPRCMTVINTNSPRQIDVPMCLGIIDFARAGQISVVTPFTLAGAMAPVTMAGALTLQHAEALAGITLAQVTRPGAPVVYGSFTSNVDMKSGAPAFGTPEFIKAAWGAGQLARHINLPWRGSAATASNIADAQSVHETQNSAWASLQGGVNLMLHAAGWLEGGLTASLEKFILDTEMLQTFAEIFDPLPGETSDMAFDAIASVEPGDHFFACEHTLERYQQAFYEPLVSDWSNFGTWEENGSQTATRRANAVWKRILKEFEPPPLDAAIHEELNSFIMRRTREGGAPID